MENQNRNLVPLLMILTVLVIAGGIYLVKTKNPISSILYPVPKVIVPSVKEAVIGGYVAGFPKELVIPKDAKIRDSHNTYIAVQKTSVLVVTYSTGATLPDLFAGYLNYFTDNDYKITLSDSKPSQSRIIASGSKFSVGVTISSLDLKNMIVEVDVTVPDPK